MRISANTKKKIKQILERRRAALSRVLDRELKTLAGHGSFDVGDAVDQAIDSDSDEISSQLAEVESRELVAIEHALRKFESGTFGICEQCEDPIPVARLEALPYATHCIRCQRAAESSGRRHAAPGRIGLSFLADTDDDHREAKLSDAEIELT